MIPVLDLGRALQGICGAGEGCRRWIATGRLGRGTASLRRGFCCRRCGCSGPEARLSSSVCCCSKAARVRLVLPLQPLGLLLSACRGCDFRRERHDARRNDGREKGEGARVEARREHQRG